MGNISSDPTFPRRGDLYFFPFPKAFPMQPEEDFFETREETLETIEGIAESRGQTHHLLSSLGLPLDRDGPYDYADQFIPCLRVCSAHS